MRERVALAINELSKKGIKKNEIASKIGVSRSFVSEVANGNTKPSIEVVEGLAVHYGEIISKEWLLTGEGDMYRQPAQQPPARDQADAARTPEEAAMLAVFRKLPAKEQAEVMQLADKEAQFVEMMQRVAELERKSA